MDRKITRIPHHNNVALFNHQHEQQPIFFYAGGINSKALLSSFEQVDIMLSRYSKVSVILFQFHQHVYRCDNAELSKLISKLKTKLQKHYKNSKIGYSWAREQGKHGDNLHYHIAFMLNGSLCNKPDMLFKFASEICKSMHPENYIWLPKRCVYNLQRHSKRHELRAARMRMSYAAKNKTKESIPTGINEYGGSQLKPLSRVTQNKTPL